MQKCLDAEPCVYGVRITVGSLAFDCIIFEEMSKEHRPDHMQRSKEKHIFSLTDLSRLSFLPEPGQFPPPHKSVRSEDSAIPRQLPDCYSPKDEDDLPHMRIDSALFYERFQFFLDYQKKSKSNGCLRYAQVRNEVYRSWMMKTLSGFDQSLRNYSRKAALRLVPEASPQHPILSRSTSHPAWGRREVQVKKNFQNHEASDAVYKALEALHKKQGPSLPRTVTPVPVAKSESSSLENQKQLMLIELWGCDILRNIQGARSLLSSTLRHHIHKELNAGKPDELVRKPQICMLYSQIMFGFDRKPDCNNLNLCWSWQLAYDEPACQINSVNICGSVGVILDSQHRQVLSDTQTDLKGKLNQVYLENYNCYTTSSYSVMPLPDDSQRAVAVYDAYIRIKRADLRKTLKEFYRVLEPDGMLQLSVLDLESMSPGGDTAYDKERRYLYDCMHDSAKDDGIDIGYVESLARILPQLGFKDVTYSVVAFPGLNSLPLSVDTFKSSSLGKNVENAGSFSRIGTKPISDQEPFSNRSNHMGYADEDMNALSEMAHNYCEFLLMFSVLHLDGSGLEEKLKKGEISLPEYVKLIDGARRYISYKCKDRRPDEFSSNPQEAKSVPLDQGRDSINAVIDSILPQTSSRRRKREEMRQRGIRYDGMQLVIIVTAKK